MADECQAKSPAPPPPKRGPFGRTKFKSSRDPDFVREVTRLRSNGMALDKIATELDCHRNTVNRVIQKQGDPLGQVETILRDGMPRIAEMVIQQTLVKKDVRAGVELLRGAGQLDTLKPKPSADEGGRIVIEWSGAPPPWSPPAVLKAYAERLAPPAPSQVIDAAPVQVPEVVQNDTNAEDRQTRVEP